MPIHHKVPDPIHGHLTIPDWLTEIESTPSVRRMLNIRQLGLKSYIDFPGAIHTRYGHSLGVMHLGGLLVDKLSEKEHDQGRKSISDNLKNNKNNLMAAGLLHDVAHGPFSHAMDFVMEKTTSMTHEKLAKEVIYSDLKQSLKNHGINPEAVFEIINNEHDFKFVSGIINGPIDVDKLDYLLRDAHHVGLKYGFDLEHFVNSYKVLGEDEELTKCLVGLDDTLEAQVTAEIFVLIWKSMYDLVYHVRDSRMVEKILEKAALLEIDNTDSELREYFTDAKKLLALDDDKLLNLLENSKENHPRLFVEKIRNRKLFNSLNDITLYQNEEISSGFITKISAANASQINDISDSISKDVCKELGVDTYRVICDIIKTRVPSNILINKLDETTGEPDGLHNRSDIIKAIKQRSTIRIYIDSDLTKNISEDVLKPKIMKVINQEGESYGN